MASRARLVTTFDAARQRVTRDLHDGAQQRFVSAIINLQLAQQTLAAEPQRARELLGLALGDTQWGLNELREIATGIHPAVLTQRGLAAALAGFIARLSVPVELELPELRLPSPIEASGTHQRGQARPGPLCPGVRSHPRGGVHRRGGRRRHRRRLGAIWHERAGWAA